MIASSKRRKPRRCSPRIANAITPVSKPGDEQRHAEQQVEPDRRAEELGDVGRHRHHLGLHPQADQCTQRGKRSRHTSGRLRPVAMPSLADRYWTSIAIRLASEHHPQQRVAELRAALDVGGEVARVDVGDRGHERRPEHRQRRPPRPRANSWSTRLGPGRAPSASSTDSSASSTAVGDLDGSGGVMTPPRHSAVARRALAAVTSTRIAPASPPPSGVHVVAEPHEQRPAERLAIDDLEARPRARSRARRGTGASPDRSRRPARTSRVARPERSARAAAWPPR